MNDTTIGLDQLGRLGSLIGAGGQAQVYHAPDITLPDMPGPLVFKRYRPGHEPPHGLHRLVARRHQLDPADRNRLDRLTAWPVRVVEQRQAVVGVLMALIPDDFFRERVLPSGRATRTAQEVQHLFVDQERALRLGMPAPSALERIMICRDFASAVHLLHRNEFVIGDINAKNAVFRLSARPSIMLVDCDAARIRSAVAVVRQLDAPDWDAPEKYLNVATDRYKFGLFVLRCLSPGAQASVSRDANRLSGLLDAEGRRLLGAALGPPSSRTTAQSWGRYFDRLMGAVANPTGIPAANAAPPPTSGWRRDPTTRKWLPVTEPG